MSTSTDSDITFNPWNVKDHLKILCEVDDIKRWQNARSNQYAIAMFNDTRDFNFASLVRNAVAFCCREVHLISDTRKWDRRGAVGAQHYIDIIHHPSPEAFFEAIGKSERLVVAVENNVDVLVPSFTYPHLPPKYYGAVFAFGAEGSGLDPSFVARCDAQYEIPIPGCMRSLNVATTSGIILAQLAN